VLVVLVGHLYGTVVPERNISFTEAEYAEAYRLGKKCLVYFRDENVPVLPKHVERDSEKLRLLEQFCQTLGSRHTVDTFRDAADLAGKVKNALAATLETLSRQTNTRAQYLALTKEGADAWNNWRHGLREGHESRANGDQQQPIDLSRADLRAADLRGFDLSEVMLNRTDLGDADLSNANLKRADLSGARLAGANLRGTLLEEANLAEANLTSANLAEADLKGANLSFARLVETNFERARLQNCFVYGVSAWSVRASDAIQSGLIISPAHEAKLTVDDIEVAQLHYLMLHSGRIRDVIGGIQTKSVLVLGRFSVDRVEIIETIRAKLRDFNFLPIVFDFERPTQRDFTETVMTLAGMSRFIIIDITNPRTTPLELQAVVPNYRIPVVPIIQSGEKPFSMFSDLTAKYPWVLPVLEYNSTTDLGAAFERAVVQPALAQDAKDSKVNLKK
jgi:uncharacterized protein YjbI with pentapeptide repeats